MLRALCGSALVLASLGLPGCGDAHDGEDAPAGGGTMEEPTRLESPPPFLPAVAITVDDLPWVGPLPPGRDRLAAMADVLGALEARGAPAAGFVNCARAEPGAPVLRAWLDAGQVLGNHTSRHLDLNSADPEKWAADARECDAFLRELTGQASLPFRYPYLHRGDTPERYRAGREALDALGATIAPVTIDTGDWIVDDAYVAALRSGDEPEAARIAEAYVDHVARAAGHYREVARERLGRDVRHILLLHANALLADHLDAVLAGLEADGFRFITLDAALEDPVYDLADDYIGPQGLSWLYRIPPAIPEAAEWDAGEAAALRALTR